LFNVTQHHSHRPQTLFQGHSIKQQPLLYTNSKA